MMPSLIISNVKQQTLPVVQASYNTSLTLDINVAFAVLCIGDDPGHRRLPDRPTLDHRRHHARRHQVARPQLGERRRHPNMQAALLPARCCHHSR